MEKGPATPFSPLLQIRWRPTPTGRSAAAQLGPLQRSGTPDRSWPPDPDPREGTRRLSTVERSPPLSSLTPASSIDVDALPAWLEAAPPYKQPPWSHEPLGFRFPPEFLP